MRKNVHPSIYRIVIYLLFICSCFVQDLKAQQSSKPIEFTVSFPDAAKHYLEVEMRYHKKGQSETILKLPNWTTGYYQLMNFSNYVDQFKAKKISGDTMVWTKTAANTWLIKNNGEPIVITYRVFANRKFVASNYVDEELAYLSPAGIFLYPADGLNQSAIVQIKPFTNWNRVATGLDSLLSKTYTYRSPDFDILYDSPFLMGSKLEDLTPFKVNGIPHYFTGYKIGEFDKVEFVEDLSKIIKAASNIIGEIPYNHYSFLAIGPGGGGIEHLNSTSISFSGQGLANRDAKIRTYNFLAHEYFHHYNVKRIRPIELGPFDYDKGSRTNLLWVSEGLSVYYEFVVLRRAGITTDEEMLQSIRQNIVSHEAKPGKHFQTLAQASWETWSDGPFGRTGDEVNKTISYYDKGPVVGAMLDFRIRHETNNKKSLDDVMRTLYYEYYKKMKRGFTEAELKTVCETVTGKKLDDFFEYIYSVKELDYKTYFGYAGLNVDQTPKIVPSYLGASVQDRRDSVLINIVDWQSPAWNAGLRRQMHVLELNGVAVTNANNFKSAISQFKTGDTISLLVLTNDRARQKVQITLSTKTEYSYEISKRSDISPKQQLILTSWMTGKL